MSTWLENVALIAQQCFIIGLAWKLADPTVSTAHMALAIAGQASPFGGGCMGVRTGVRTGGVRYQVCSSCIGGFEEEKKN